MNYNEKKALVRCQRQITRDLEVKYIIDSLLENKILQEQDKNEILLKSDDEVQARLLLEFLPNRGPDAFIRFVEALKADYYWLADNLEEEFEAAETSKIDDLSDGDLDKQNETLLKDLLKRGGVPLRPNHFIARDDLLRQIKDNLCKLEPGDFLTLHGMPVSGKLVMASEALRDPEVTLKCFPDGVIWFRVGIISSREKLLNRLRILCEKLDAEKLPTDIEEAQEILKKLLLSERFRRCLLVLHDVWRGSEAALSVTRMFVDCCRILLTTRDITVLDPVPRQCKKAVIQLPTGFDEQESLQLFSSYVNVDAKFLPEEAKLIHEECQGSPFVISMLGSMIAEGHSAMGMRRDEAGRWAYYLKSLRDRKYNRLKKRQSYQHESVMDTIMVSIDNLEESLKQRYKSLVVFIDNNSLPKDNELTWTKTKHLSFGGLHKAGTNDKYFRKRNYGSSFNWLLPFQVLMTYWDVNDIEVDNIMTDFLQKSLAKSVFDDNLATYVYSIHILFLDYLKTGLTKDEERKFHEDLLNKYFEKCYGDYGDIEDDSYVFNNLGHHLVKSGKTHLFPEIYLDLKYVEACLNSTSYSSVDLLNDYTRYGEYIEGEDGEFMEELDDFEAFVRTIGGLVNSEAQVDIVQLALGESQESSVRKKATILAQQRPNRLYFQRLNPGPTRELHMATIMHHGAVETAVFLSPSSHILTANGDGQIKMWDIISGAVQHRLTGHRSKVRCISLSPDGLRCVSGSENGVVKVWDLSSPLESLDGDSDDFFSGKLTDSLPGRDNKSSSLKRRSSFQIQQSKDKYALQQILAKDRQDVRDLSHQSFNFYELHEEMVLCVDFSPSGDEVVAAGNSGHLKVYNLTHRTVRLKFAAHKDPVNVCRFSASGKTICSGSDDATVRMFSADSGEFRGSLNLHNLRVLDICSVPLANKMISLSVDKLVCWNNFSEEVPTVSADAVDQQLLSLDTVDFHRNRKSDFMCMAFGGGHLPYGGGGGSVGGVTLLAAATVDNLITVWDFDSAQVLLSLPGHSSHIHVLNFNEDARLLLSGSDDETVMIWSLESVEACRSNHSADDGVDSPEPETAHPSLPLNLGPAFDVIFVADVTPVPVCTNSTALNSDVIIAAPDERNHLSLLGNGNLIFGAPNEASTITCVSISEDLSTVAYGCLNGLVRAWLPWKGRVVALGSHKSKVTQVLATGHGIVSACKDSEVKIWPASDGISAGATPNFTGHACAVTGGASSVKEVLRVPGANQVLTRCTNGSLRLWKFDSGLAAQFDYPTDVQAFSTCMDVCPVNEVVVMARASGPMVALKLASLELIQELAPTQAQHGPVRSCRFSPDGKLLARGYDTGILEILEFGTWQRCYKQIRAHQTWVKDIRFNDGGNKLVTAGDKIIWWNLDVLNDSRRKSSRRRRSSAALDLFKRRSRVETSGDRSPKKTINSPPDSGTTSKRTSGIYFPLDYKEGCNPNCKERLQQFDFIGSQTNKIFVSKDFKVFGSLDDVGIPYILSEICVDSTESKL